MTFTALNLAGARNPRGLVLCTLSAAPWLAAGAAALMVLQQVASFTVPVLIGLAIDNGVATGDLGGVAFWAAVLVADFLVLVFAYQYGSRLGLRAVESVQHRLRLAVTDRLLGPTGFSGPRATGELLSIAGSDVTRLSQSVLIVIFPIAELAALGYAGVALTLIWWPLGVAVLAGGVVLVLTMEWVGRPFRERTEREQERIAGVGAVTADMLTGARTLRGFGAASWALERHTAANREALAATKRARAAEQRFVALSRSLSALLVVAIAVVAGYLALAGTITVGQLVIVVGLVQLVIGPLEALAINLATVWLAALASAARVLALLSEGESRPEPGATVSAGGDGAPEIELREMPLGTGAATGVGTRAGPGGVGIGLSLAARRGQIVGVAAPTVVAHELIAALRHCGAVHAGRIVLGGSDSATLPAAQLAERLLVAAQRVAGASLRPAGAAHRAAAQTVSPAISGGELQRAALAQAYAAHTPALVLHDPTSSLDPATEQLIADCLRDTVRDRAVLLVTTSPALLAVTDEVHVVGAGGVIRGRHHELLGSPEYRELLG